MTLLEFATIVMEQDPLTQNEQRYLPHLVDVALMARRAGVTPSLDELAGASPIERAAWIEAGAAYDAEIAQRNGLAAQGRVGMALAQADLDDGAEANRQLSEAGYGW